MQILSFVVPVYNEVENIPNFIKELSGVCKNISEIDFEIIFAMDPSTDGTEEEILKQRNLDGRIKLLKFAHRVGQPLATIAGIHKCKGDACIVMDVDLQDPPELVVQMVDKWRKGYDVVYAARKDRKYENFFRRILGHMYYHFLNKLSDIDIPKNTGDFRLMDRRVVEQLKRFKEGHGFLRGMVSFIGFKQAAIYFDRKKRTVGDTKYPRFTGSIKVALNGIAAFSNRPLKFATYAGVLGIMFALVLIILNLFGIFSQSFTSPFFGILLVFIVSFQMLTIGILGEYVGRIYDEVRDRPLYIIDREEGF